MVIGRPLQRKITAKSGKGVTQELQKTCSHFKLARGNSRALLKKARQNTNKDGFKMNKFYRGGGLIAGRI